MGRFDNAAPAPKQIDHRDQVIAWWEPGQWKICYDVGCSRSRAVSRVDPEKEGCRLHNLFSSRKTVYVCAVVVICIKLIFFHLFSGIPVAVGSDIEVADLLQAARIKRMVVRDVF